MVFYDLKGVCKNILGIEGFKIMEDILLLQDKFKPYHFCTNLRKSIRDVQKLRPPPEIFKMFFKGY